PSLGSLSGVVTKTDTVSHILCWVDGTDEACRAAEYAASVAKNLGAGLTYLAVGDEPEPNAGFEDFARIEDVSEPMTPTLEGNVRACLHRAATTAAQTGVHCAAQLVHAGKPADAICATAQSQGADLVVIRKRDTGLFKRFLTTSVLEALVNQCNFAVLSVR
ncbi:MAG: universal stress protein, partial [Pseudomonadota bacterium]